ncbi:MAG: M48 family metallopeptidase [Lachnospiraceae bacterium]|nr:M48 family metallopeptidase [Lachnospiraceae bacterium]
MNTETVNGHELKIEIIRSARKTISLEMKPGGVLIVRAPRRMSEKAVMDVVAKHSLWISRRLKKQQELAEQAGKETANVLGPEELKKLKKKARKVFAERAAYFAPLVGVDYHSISIRLQKSRFGSCSAKGNLNFNAALLLAPAETLDYVVVHELCHRLEMNHSPRFWREVERVLPDYRRQKKWLKDNGSLILARCGVV